MSRGSKWKERPSCQVPWDAPKTAGRFGLALLRTPPQSSECIAACKFAQHEKKRFFFALQHQQRFIVVAKCAPKQLQSLKQGLSQCPWRVHWSLARPFQKLFSSQILAATVLSFGDAISVEHKDI